MLRGKHGLKYKFCRGGAKHVLLSLALTLVLYACVGGTVAWLVAETDPVKNTFTYGDINIGLTETSTNEDDDDDPNTNRYQMVPGKTIEKDPKVTVKAGSEDAWLFVRLEKSANFDRFMEYAVIPDDPATADVAEGWTALEGVDGVYFLAVRKTDFDAEIYVLKDNAVYVKSDVTKEMLNALDKNGADDYPTLTVTAYAVQRDEKLADIDTAAEAWAKVDAGN